MSKSLKTLIFFPVILLFISLPVFLFATEHNPDQCGGAEGCPPPAGEETYKFNIPNPLKSGTDSLQDFIMTVIRDVVIPIGGVVAVFFIVYSGFLFVTARGSEDKLKTAKRALLYSVIGTAILLGAWVIAEVIASTINQLR